MRVYPSKKARIPEERSADLTQQVRGLETRFGTQTFAQVLQVPVERQRPWPARNVANHHRDPSEQTLRFGVTCVSGGAIVR